MTTRPPPPSGRPPMYAVAGRAFGRTNLRPVVIASAIAAIVWSLVWGAGAFSDLSNDKQTDESKKLLPFDIVIGSLYSVVAAIELFGMFAAITRRTPLARIYVGLSLLVVLLVASAELLRTIVHFSLKSAIIAECAVVSSDDNDNGFGFWGGSSRSLNPTAAQNFCSDAYSRDSFSTIAWLILATLLTLFFASTAYSFYRQLLDPTSFRAPRAPSDQVRLEHMHGQPYGGGYTPYPGFNAAPRYAPPPGAPPPGFGGYAAPPYEGGKLPGYASDLGHGGKDLDGDDKKDPNAFMEPQHFGAGPSEAELARPGYRV